MKEPVILINGITAAIEAGILMFVAFGLDWSPEQIATVMGFVLALGLIAQTMVVRANVTPTADPQDNEGRALVPLQKPPPEYEREV